VTINLKISFIIKDFHSLIPFKIFIQKILITIIPISDLEELLPSLIQIKKRRQEFLKIYEENKLRNQSKSARVNNLIKFKEYSSGCISRTNLRYRLKIQ